MSAPAPRPLTRIAHRGGGSLAPENSLAGIARSLQFGVEMIEVDVRRSLDGALVLSHDPAPHGSSIAVRASTLAELRAAHDDIATLHEAIDAVRGRARLNLDIKESDIADDVAALVREHGAEEWCIVSCLESACLARFAEVAPGLPRFISYPPDYGGASRKAYMTPVVNAAVTYMRMTMPRRLRAMVTPLPGTNATIYARLVTPRLVATARALGISLYTWTVDDLAEMRRLRALGVDGITSNRPDLLAQLASTPAAPRAIDATP